MFVPIDGAYALAVQEDRDLHEYAWKKRVVIVCPTTLFATMKTIASVWRLERQNQNAQEIARQGGALYDKVHGFLSDMYSIGSQIEKLDESYGKAMNKLSEGRGNIISRIGKLKDLGAKTTKSLPTELLITEDESPAEVLSEEEKEQLDRETGT
jgi:DNA recombination protein RmuC